MHHNHRHRFTMIGVITMLLALALASIFIIPLFFTVDVGSRQILTQSLGSTLKANAAIAHSISLESDRPSQVEMNGAGIEMVYEFPSATPSGIGKSDKKVVGFLSEYSLSEVRFNLPGVTNPNTCQVVYTQPTEIGMPPGVAINISDCA